MNKITIPFFFTNDKFLHCSPVDNFHKYLVFLYNLQKNCTAQFTIFTLVCLPGVILIEKLGIFLYCVDVCNYIHVLVFYWQYILDCLQNYCGIITVCWRPMFEPFVGNPCTRIFNPSNLYASKCLVFIYKIDLLLTKLLPHEPGKF